MRCGSTGPPRPFVSPLGNEEQVVGCDRHGLACTSCQSDGYRLRIPGLQRNPEERDAKEGPPSFQDILVLLLAAIMILSLLRFFFRVLVIFLSVVAAAWVRTAQTQAASSARAVPPSPPLLTMNSRPPQNYSFLAVVLIMIIGLFTV